MSIKNKFSKSIRLRMGTLSIALASLLETASRADTPPTVIDVTFAMIWEGETPTPVNIDEIKNFRDQYPAVKFVHFISPAYVSRLSKPAPEPYKSQIGSELNAVVDSVLTTDAIGVYMNGWKSITDAAGVRFKNGPTFWGNEISSQHCKLDCGREVMMTAYPFDDLRKLFRQSRKLFKAKGLGEAKVMLVAGNLASPELLQAASVEGFTHDFSAVAAELISDRLFRYPLRKEIEGLWGGVGPDMQPFMLETAQHVKMTQMTSNGVHLQIMSFEDINKIIKRTFDTLESDKIDRKKTTIRRHLYVGIAAESFSVNKAKLNLTVQELFKQSSDKKVGLNWTAETIDGKKEPSPPLATSH